MESFGDPDGASAGTESTDAFSSLAAAAAVLTRRGTQSGESIAPPVAPSAPID